MIKGFARYVYEKVEIRESKQLQLSDGWLSIVKRNHQLRHMVLHGEAGSANVAAVEKEKERLLDTMIDKHITEGKLDRNDVYNMDETAFFYVQAPTSELASKRKPGQKRSKARITVALCCNASAPSSLHWEGV